MTNPDLVVVKSVAGLYREKSCDAELVSQAIMGQPVHIEKADGDWLYVRTWDAYHGWMQKRWAARPIPRLFRTAVVTSLFTDALRTPNHDAEIWTKMVITTTVELLGERDELGHIRLPDGKEAWTPMKDIGFGAAYEEPLPLPPIGSNLVRTAKRFLGVPYLWGGTTPFGLDCSGFTQLVHRINGVKLLRDASMQAQDARFALVEKADLAAGDLIFFSRGEESGDIAHVGIACGDGTFIHCAGNGVGVTINRLDDAPYDRSYQRAGRMRG